ncbi:MAG: hypothetical protein IK120_00450 [Muribaculaceae bacterium]|nr:hypothetical protein [Muribaculaceae bacterium]
MARFGTENHRPQGVKAGFWANRAKNPNTHFSLARYFGKKIDCPTDAEQSTKNYALCIIHSMII